jgi:hypothetical protein
MTEQKIGFDFSKTFKAIANFYEVKRVDYKMADKIYRIGVNHLMNKTEKEFISINYYYQ